MIKFLKKAFAVLGEVFLVLCGYGLAKHRIKYIKKVETKQDGAFTPLLWKSLDDWQQTELIEHDYSQLTRSIGFTIVWVLIALILYFLEVRNYV